MKLDARDMPLDEFEQEVLGRLLRAHAAQSAVRDGEGRLSVPAAGAGAHVPAPETAADVPAAAARVPVPETAADVPAAARRQRLQGPRRRGLVAVIAVTLLATSGALAAVSLLAGSTTPVRLYGGRDLCPANYDVAGQISTGLFYPANYPGRALPRGDIRCFASAQYARQDGYREAPTPRGYTQVGPIYFAPTPASVRRTCATAAREISAVIYCPTRLPAPWIHPLINWDCPTVDCDVRLLSLSGSFPATSSYAGASDPGDGQVTFWSASAGQQRAFPYVLYECASPRHLLGRTRFRGHPATWYACSIFNNASTVLRWRIGTQTYQISADGPARLRRALVRYIAENLVAEPR